MRKLRKPLLLAAAALVIVTAAVLGILSAVKTTPWELTYHLVPSDVTSALLWQGSSSAQLSGDEVIKIVHLLNKMEKSSYTIKYGHVTVKPQYGLILHCGGMDINLNEIKNPHGSLIMMFDKSTAKSFATGQWIVNSPELSAYLEKLLSTKQGLTT